MDNHQFALLDKLTALYKESQTRISTINKELADLNLKVTNELKEVYPIDQQVLYLMTGLHLQQKIYTLQFHKAVRSKMERKTDTGGELITIKLLFFGKHSPGVFDGTQESAENILTYATEQKDICSKINVDTYTEFGYFDDIHDYYMRENWISEQLFAKDIPYIISEAEYLAAVEQVDLFLKRKPH